MGKIIFFVLKPQEKGEIIFYVFSKISVFGDVGVKAEA